uniref:HOXA10 n=1 Tax=Anas platyrhynchos platyrhynchos TaxID=8840 RepID=A0A493TSV0_ANAPP
MSCSESPAANSFLVDSLISSGRGEAAGAGGGGGGGGGYYPNSGIYLPQASDLSYGLQSCGLFPVLSKRNEGTSQSMVPTSHPYVSGMEVWLDPPPLRRGAARGCPLSSAAPRPLPDASISASRPGRGEEGGRGALPQPLGVRLPAGGRDPGFVFHRRGALPSPVGEQQSLSRERARR